MAGPPSWRKIADDLQRRIEAREFHTPPDIDPTDTAPATDRRPKLPTELVLQEQYSASRSTVRDAIKWLTDKQLVETEAGRGTFVVVKRDPFHVTLSGRSTGGPGGGEGIDYQLDAQVQGRNVQDSELRVEIQKATGVIAQELRIPVGSQVVLRHQRRFVDDQPWSLQTSYYPWRFVEEGALRLLDTSGIEQGAVKYLEEELGRKQAGYHDSISARMPEPGEAMFFGLPERGQVAVFNTYRTAFDQDGRPCRLTITVWPIDRNRLHYNIGEVPNRVIERPADPVSPPEQ